MSNSSEKNDNLTFSQREGIAPLPTLLQRGDIPRGMRGMLYRHTIQYIGHSSFSNFTSYVLYQVKITMDSNSFNEMNVDKCSQFWVGLAKGGLFNEVFDFLEIFMKAHKKYWPTGFKSALHGLKNTFEIYRVAYFVDIENCKIVPKSTEEEGRVIQEGAKTLKEEKQDGALDHYTAAVDSLNKGSWTDSIRESIHMVESVARKKTKEQDLKKALQCFDVHAALKRGWGMLYGFTSDSKDGIRHSRTNDRVTEADEALALYMFGACISFAAYLSKQTPKQPKGN